MAQNLYILEIQFKYILILLVIKNTNRRLIRCIYNIIYLNFIIVVQNILYISGVRYYYDLSRISNVRQEFIEFNTTNSQKRREFSAFFSTEGT
jgi:hypothetical protein